MIENIYIDKRPINDTKLSSDLSKLKPLLKYFICPNININKVNKPKMPVLT